MAKIFISYSGKITRRVALDLVEMLGLFWDKDDIFLDVKDPEAGDWQQRIERNMQGAEIGISILSKENENAPWLLWEAGFMAGTAKFNGCEIIPFLFCRSADSIESPISKKHAFVYEHGNTDEINQSNLQEMIKFFKAINGLMDIESKVNPKTIEHLLKAEWKNFQLSLGKHANRMYDYVASEVNKAENIENLYFDSSLFGFETEKQSIYWTSFDNLQSHTPGSLEYMFDEILEYFVPNEWRYKDEQYNAHRVMVNQTRISTFVAFTDGKNILLFDRRKDPKNTNVVNQRWDVFGSVQFENRTLKNKIQSDEFLNAKIKKIKPIYGAAFENNKHKQDSKDLETVVMFGVLVHLSEEDLLLALKGNSKKNGNALAILPKKEALALLPNDLTSKAYLSIKQLYSE